MHIEDAIRKLHTGEAKLIRNKEFEKSEAIDKRGALHLLIGTTWVKQRDGATRKNIGIKISSTAMLSRTWLVIP